MRGGKKIHNAPARALLAPVERTARRQRTHAATADAAASQAVAHVSVGGAWAAWARATAAAVRRAARGALEAEAEREAAASGGAVLTAGAGAGWTQQGGGRGAV